MTYQTPTTGKSIWDYNSFGALLKDYRIAHGLNQKFIADLSEVSEAYVSKVESGKIKEPTGTFVVRVANYFRWGAQDLYELFESSKLKALDARISELEAQVDEEDKFPSGSVLADEAAKVLLKDARGRESYVRLLEHVVSLYGREHRN